MGVLRRLKFGLLLLSCAGLAGCQSEWTRESASVAADLKGLKAAETALGDRGLRFELFEDHRDAIVARWDLEYLEDYSEAHPELRLDDQISSMRGFASSASDFLSNHNNLEQYLEEPAGEQRIRAELALVRQSLLRAESSESAGETSGWAEPSDATLRLDRVLGERFRAYESAVAQLQEQELSAVVTRRSDHSRSLAWNVSPTSEDRAKLEALSSSIQALVAADDAEQSDHRPMRLGPNRRDYLLALRDLARETLDHL